MKISIRLGFFMLLFALSSCLRYPYVNPAPYIEAASRKKPYDVIIVPGYSHKDGKWDNITKIRMYWSKYLLENGFVKNVIYSGGANYSPYVEGKIMALYARAIGIPQEHILVEDKAEFSAENLYFSYQMAQRSGFKSIALATDPFQTGKLLPIMEKLNIHADVIPADFGILQSMEKPDVPINDTIAFVKDFTPLKKRMGIFKRLKHTQGKHLKPLKD